ncbi:MAG: 6-phosphofructokinase [Lachnospiraceae bacterium]|nr:6-phosphofructokinase [Lachnospiraceae bacterium]
MKKNLLVAQSGGPTAAINATLAGVIGEAKAHEEIDRVIGACYGIQGVLEEKFIDLTELVDTEEKLEKLRVTPAAALGSCRFKLKDISEDDSQYRQIVEILHKHDIGYFIYIGGNDSMDTVAKLSKYCKDKGIDDIQVVGGPKTIDNDLMGIDHCPGFGSAAKYIAAVFAELEQEMCVYDTKSVIVVEMMGRHAGWLTAAAALADIPNADVPYLIYLEERPFSIERFIEDLKTKLDGSDVVMIAVSEGVHDEEGRFICESVSSAKGLDVFGHAQLSGTGKILENAIRDQIGCKVRSIELNLLQRCASHILSATDIEESGELGANAVRLAVAKQTGLMSSLRRVSNTPYRVAYEGVDIQQVANAEKKVPQEWINEDGNGVTQECIDYLLPLIQGEMSCHFRNGVPDYLILK